jgi:hypothetical protein
MTVYFDKSLLTKAPAKNESGTFDESAIGGFFGKWRWEVGDCLLKIKGNHIVVLRRLR